MSGLPPRSENHATRSLPSCASSTLGSSSFVGLPTERRAGGVASNVGPGALGSLEQLMAASAAIAGTNHRAVTTRRELPAYCIGGLLRLDRERAITARRRCARFARDGKAKES